jgi:hypothetical protein
VVAPSPPGGGAIRTQHPASAAEFSQLFGWRATGAPKGEAHDMAIAETQLYMPPSPRPKLRPLEDERWLALVLLIPTLVLLGTFIAYPFVRGIMLSMMSARVGVPGEFVGPPISTRSGTTRSSARPSTTRSSTRPSRRSSSWRSGCGSQCC